MTNIDRVLRDHAAQAARTTPAAGGFERLVAGLDDLRELGVPATVVPASPSWRSRLPLLAAAAIVVVLVGVGAVLAWPEDDGGHGVDTAPATEVPTTPTVPSTDGTAPESPDAATTVLPAPGPDMPGSVLVVLRDPAGVTSAVRLDGLAAGADPAGVASATLIEGAGVNPGEPEAGGFGVSGADVAGGVAYVETCCEPAVGEVVAVDLASGERRGGDDRGVVAYGTSPAASADGRLAVYREGFGVVVVDSNDPDGVEEHLGGPLEGRFVRELAWSPDGRRLARTTASYEGGVTSLSVEVYDLDVPTDGWVGVGPAGGAGMAMPAFLGDGRLVVGTGITATDLDLTATGISVVDLDTFDAQQAFGDLRITDLDATPDGSWVVVASGGDLRAFEGPELIDRGTVARIDGKIVGVAW